MKIERLFLALNLLLVLVSTTAHNVAADSAEANALILVTLFVCGAVWVRTTQGRPIALGNVPATLLCTAGFALMLLRGLSSTGLGGVRMLDVRVPAVGEFLVIFQWVYLLRDKAPRDYFWMYLVSVVHMGTAGLLMPGVLFGFFFVAYALTGVCALATYHLWTEVRAAGEQALRETRIRLRFIAAALPLTLILMLPVAALFAVLPRKVEGSILSASLVRLGGQSVAGFSNTVRLGEVGAIQDNPRKVMTLAVRDAETGRAIEMPGLLLRGVALDQYLHEEGHWMWRLSLNSKEDWRTIRTDDHAADGVAVRYLRRLYGWNFPGYDATDFRRVQCDIILEPLQERYLFAPFAAESITGLPENTWGVEGNIWTHALRERVRNWRTPAEYSVISRIHSPGIPDARLPQYSWTERYLAPFRQLPADLSPRVRTLARSIIRESERPTDAVKAQRILDYLSDSSRFTYTLNQDPTPGVEPVEDFLFNRKQGHCEYFASAMVVLCRSVGMAARLVNGFRVSEWNPLGNHYVVRQSNAHSWAEVYIHPVGWRTFDPSVDREAAGARPVVVRRWGRHLYDAVESLWVHYVLNYDADNQSQIYRGIGEKVDRLRELWQEVIVDKGAEPLAYSEGQVRWLLHQLAEPLRIGLLAALLFLAFWMVWLAGRWGRRFWRGRRAPTPAWFFYHRMERRLARAGHTRRATQTPWEFHDALAAEGWPAMDAVRTITSAFCDARYGAADLPPDRLDAVAAALDALRRARGKNES